MENLFTPETIVTAGAIYAAVQGVANAIMLLMTEKRNHTILFKICKAIVAGPRRAPLETAMKRTETAGGGDMGS